MTQLVRLAEHGAPVCVASEGVLALALRHSNNSSADVYVDEITNTIRKDVRFGHAFVLPREAAARIPGLRVSPLAVIQSRRKLRLMQDLTFSCGQSTTVVDEDTAFSSAPTCEIGHVPRDFIWR